MRMHEYGTTNDVRLLMFHCAIEPWWAFVPAAEALARDFHVYLVAMDGLDEAGTDFVSVEKNVEEAVSYLRDSGIERLDLAYGVSIGGASVMHLLATQAMPVTGAIIDAGITPYPYPKLVCRLIAIKDYLAIKAGYSSLWMMKRAMPPERWTPKGDDPARHYRRVFEFGKRHLSNRTIYNSFWSANNYSMPDPIPPVSTRIEYWYGEAERSARRANLAYAQRAFPQVTPVEFPGLEHAELVMMHPERLRDEILRFWSNLQASSTQQVSNR